MDKDFMQYVRARIEKALTESEEYKKLQDKCLDANRANDLIEYENASCAIECKAEELCYIQGFNDAIQLLMNSKGVGQA